MARGYFGIGIENCKKEVNLGTLWRSAHCLGASFIFTVGKRYTEQPSDTMKSYRHIPLYEYLNAEEFISGRPRGSLVIGVELTSDARPLKNFVHPEQAIYLLGPEDSSISSKLLDMCNYVVQINSSRCLNVAVAGSIVMYDRQVKQ